VVIAKIFVRPDCDILVVLVTGIIIGLVGKGVSTIGCTGFVLQENVVLFLLW
jgi:hypothetical protein